MNENPSGMTHPEELLAGYVDGSASPDERASVDTHLPFCPRCTNEVRLARAGRAALAALPELDSPGLAGTILSVVLPSAGVSDIDDLMAAGLADQGSPAATTFGAASDASPPEDRVVVPLSEAKSRRNAGRIVTAIAGVAVAAALVAVAVIVLPHPAAKEAAGAPSSGSTIRIAKASSPPFSSTNFTAKSLDAFARNLAAADQAPKGPAGTSPTSIPVPVPAFDEIGVQCAEQGAGVSPNAEVQYFATGRFEGAPAYVAVFRLPGPPKPYLVVVAVTPKGCQPLHYARQTI